MSGRVLTDWRPDDEQFWSEQGGRVARRNLWCSVLALFLAFAIWVIWAVVVVELPRIGFEYTTAQLFWLAALPGLSGATFRFLFSFVIPIFGGRLWTTLSTALLLLPAVGIGIAVQNPDTSFGVFAILALLCGLGGGSFSSSMANISYFFPRRSKGNALAVNGGLGNVGVAFTLYILPIVITAGVFGFLGGKPQPVVDGGEIWLQNAGYIFVPFLIVSCLLAWFGMDDIAEYKGTIKEQSIIFQRKHNWVMCLLYTGTFGSFIGYSAGLPLLSQIEFPESHSLAYVFIGPLLGSLSRAGSGWISDRYGGGRVTFWVFVVMFLAAIGVLYFMANKDAPNAFMGFFTMFMVLYIASGIGNASTFQMVQPIMKQEIDRLMPEKDEKFRHRQTDIEAGTIIGFSSAIAAFGGFFIPESYSLSILMIGVPDLALVVFIGFYAVCILATWWYYTRKNAEVPC